MSDRVWWGGLDDPTTWLRVPGGVPVRKGMFVAELPDNGPWKLEAKDGRVKARNTETGEVLWLTRNTGFLRAV